MAFSLERRRRPLVARCRAGRLERGGVTPLGLRMLDRAPSSLLFAGPGINRARDLDLPAALGQNGHYLAI